MKPLKKRVITTTTLILILTFAAMMAVMPSAQAADIPTFAFISVQPNPVGINQQVYVLMWLDNPPPTAGGAGGDRWQGYMCAITKPDGTTENKGPYTSDAVSGAGFAYTPTIIGKYTFQFSFPGQRIVGEIPGLFGPPAPIDATYAGSTSKVFELIVQSNALPAYQPAPLPTGYWTRPIYGENREWAPIGGNWLMPAYNNLARAFDWGTAFSPNRGPNSAHIVWTKPITMGGIVGTDMGSVSYYTGLSYEMMFKPPVIINGYLYYNLYKSTMGGAPYEHPGFACVDMRTGEELWRNMETSIDFGQIFDYESMNQAGALAYLWSVTGTTWSMYDAFTGVHILDIENAPAAGGMFGGSPVAGPHGELLMYQLDSFTNTMSLWNSTTATPPAPGGGANDLMWRPYTWLGQTLDGTAGFQWNKTVPAHPGAAIVQIEKDVIYAATGGGFLDTQGYNSIIQYDRDGNELKVTNIARDASVPGSTAGPIGAGVYAEYSRQLKQWFAYDLNTGQKAWGPTTAYPNDWAMYGSYMGRMIAYGNLYHAGYDGYIHAFDAQTGNSKWDYYSGNAGEETPYGTYPFYGGFVVSDNKIYAHTGEHSPTTPLWRGESLNCMNAQNGQQIWKITGWFQHPVVADGYLLSLNGYDNKIYCFGKGPSETTVSAPLTAVAKGTAMMITGTVTDQSPAQKGTPAVSDGSMSAWMEYLNMQQAMPATVTGVNVKLTAIDSNGVTTDLGTVTSDSSGLFKKAWTPTAEGEFTIKATFDGTESYGNSFATTAVVVTSTATAGTQTSTGTSLDLYIIGATIVTLIAIIVATLVLRKKP